MADSNCASKLMAALMNDGNGQIVTEAEANAGAADPSNTNIYICIDMGSSGVICIRRPRQGIPVRVKL